MAPTGACTRTGPGTPRRKAQGRLHWVAPFRRAGSRGVILWRWEALSGRRALRRLAGRRGGPAHGVAISYCTQAWIFAGSPAALRCGRPRPSRRVGELGTRDSNPNFDIQSVACCRYTSPQCISAGLAAEGVEYRAGPSGDLANVCSCKEPRQSVERLLTKASRQARSLANSGSHPRRSPTTTGGSVRAPPMAAGAPTGVSSWTSPSGCALRESWSLTCSTPA